MTELGAVSNPAIIASLIAAAVTTIGIAAVWAFRDWATRSDALLSAFAAGILLASALVHVIPESNALNPQAPLYVLLGFVALFVLNKTAGHHHPSDQVLPPRAIIAPFLGIAFHSFVDGMVYATAFSVDFVMGVSAASGLIIHEFSEGLVLFVLVRSAGASPSVSFVLAFLGAALTTPLGATSSLYAIQSLTPEHLGILLGLSGGALLYVSTVHLTERFVRAKGFLPLGGFAAGIAVAFVMLSSHGHHDDHGHAGHAETGHEDHP